MSEFSREKVRFKAWIGVRGVLWLWADCADSNEEIFSGEREGWRKERRGQRQGWGNERASEKMEAVPSQKSGSHWVAQRGLEGKWRAGGRQLKKWNKVVEGVLFRRRQTWGIMSFSKSRKKKDLLVFFWPSQLSFETVFFMLHKFSLTRGSCKEWVNIVKQTLLNKTGLISSVLWKLNHGTDCYNKVHSSQLEEK